MDTPSTTSLGNFCQWSVTLMVKTFFLIFIGNLVFHFLPIVSCLSLGTTEKSLAPSSLYLPFRYLYTLINDALSLLFSRLNSPRSLSFSFCKRCSSPLITVMFLHWSLSCSLISLPYSSFLNNHSEILEQFPSFATNTPQALKREKKSSAKMAGIMTRWFESITDKKKMFLVFYGTLSHVIKLSYLLQVHSTRHINLCYYCFLCSFSVNYCLFLSTGAALSFHFLVFFSYFCICSYQYKV